MEENKPNETLTNLEDTNLNKMLEFENELFLEILHNDGLVITAKGLNIDVVLTNLLKVYCDPGNLVIVMNYTDYEEKFYSKKLNGEHVYSASLNVNDREEKYALGGIHFITTRILVIDLLKNRIPINKITGIFVLRAHSVLESCQEAFVLRLYRQSNKTGFIKAFSSCAESFTYGFGQVERIMQSLLVKELFIWPRFHALVRQSLKEHEPVIVELHIPISATMKNIQTSLLDLMNITVKELKRINPTLEMQEITVENCIAKKFHKILQAQLDCIWHQLSSKSKQLIADLKTLRYLIITLLHNDPMTFYSVISKYRTMEYAQTSTWVLLDSAEALFNNSNKLVFSKDKELNPEFCSKWNVLSEILKIEIPAEVEKENTDEAPKILILCQDAKTCYQINQYLTYGGEKYLLRMAWKYDIKYNSVSKKLKDIEKSEKYVKQFYEKRDEQYDKPKKKTKTGDDDNEDILFNSMMEEKKKMFENMECDFENNKSCYILTMSQGVNAHCLDDEEKDGDETNESHYTFEPFPEMEDMDLTTVAKKDPVVVIQTFKNDNNALSLQETLSDFQPNYIIMYHSNMTAIRQIEMYESRRIINKPTKVYFLIHTETVEEQSYLTALRREKQAFEYLISAKSRMVVPEYQDGKSNEYFLLQNEEKALIKNTRHGHKPEEQAQLHKIIVDMREFRSDLPALIHKRGIQIEPVTITVGDYILTPDVCVERKSISDLIGSLNSGRLYQQCTQMTRYYTKPMLLIEFDQNQPFKFQFQGKYMISNESGDFETQKKLQLLTIHFPKLKIVWSPSPYASAQLFEELKEGKLQPSVEYANAISSENDIDIIQKQYNSNIYDFIQKLPGITSKNITAFLKHGKNLDTVLKMSEEELKEKLGNSTDAKLFYNILHEKHTQANLNLNKKGGLKTKFGKSIFNKKTKF